MGYARNMRKHDCYHEITAKTHDEMGFKIGTVLRDSVLQAVSELPRLQDRAQPILAASLAETRARYPHYVEELEGYARGAGVSFGDLWRLSLEADMEPFEHCTTVITNGGRLLIHNEDWLPSATERIFLLKREIGGHVTFEIHYSGTLGGNAFSVNSGGLVQAINIHRVRRTDWTGPLVPTNVSARRVLDVCMPETTLAELEAVRRISGYTYVLLDLGGRQDPHVVEAAHDACRSWKIKDFPFVHTNHYLTRDFAHMNVIIPPDITSSPQRYAAACKLARASMTMDAAMRLSTDVSGGPVYSIMNEDTVGSVVLDLDNRLCRIWMRRESDKGWIEYPLEF